MGYLNNFKILNYLLCLRWLICHIIHPFEVYNSVALGQNCTVVSKINFRTSFSRRKFHTPSALGPPTSPSLGNHHREHWVLNKRPEVCFTWVFCLCDVGQAAEPFRMYCADVIQGIGLSALNSCLAGLRGEKRFGLTWEGFMRWG